MTHEDEAAAVAAVPAVWRKASASDANSGCVEVAALPDGRMGIRDSMTLAMPAIEVTAPAWTSFLAAAKAGQFGA